MNDSSFFNNFLFIEFTQTKLVHNNISNGNIRHHIGVMKKGKAKLCTDNKTLELSEGDMFYIPKGLKYHSYWNTEETVAIYDSIGFVYFPASDSSSFTLQTVKMTPEIYDAYSYFLDNKDVNLKSISVLYNVLSMLETVLEKETKTKAETIVDNLISMMNTDPLKSIGEYAQELNISEALLYRYTKKILNQTPNTLRQKSACSKAASLLSATHFSIEEISDKCGFSSSSYFRKVMYSVYHKTPTQIRKEANII